MTGSDGAQLTSALARELEEARAEINELRRRLAASPPDAARLGERERHLRSVIDATPIVLWEIDQDGTILVSEGRGLASLGLAPGELVGKTVFDVYAGAPEALALIQRGLAGEDFIAETAIGRGWWRNHYTPLHDERGAVRGLVGTSVDITDRKRAEKALRQSEGRFHAFLEHAADGIFVMDPQTGWPPACARRSTGTSRAERTGRPPLRARQRRARAVLRSACGRTTRPRLAPEGVSMGDKSPKAKDKAKKQDTAGKNQKKATADAKQKASATVEKKGK